MSDTVTAQKLGAMIPLSHEVLEDAQIYQTAFAHLQDDLNWAMSQAMVDMIAGPRLGPGRGLLWEITRPARRRDRLRAELATMGKPAGPYVRPSRG